MCGICGKYAPDGVDIEEIRRMGQAIAHRGPDDEGYFIRGQIGLGNRRLSIIDLATGHQPISNEDETVWIVYNGEIYNYQELRTQLEQNGHTFRTNSDTEVIVHLYEDQGERCVEKLRGMFSFAIWDASEHKLFLARDRLGQKPLFYAEIGDSFVFASEIKGILASNGLALETDLVSMHHYLSLRFIPSPRTMFRHVHKLPPGHFLVYHKGQAHISRYWDLSFRHKLDLDEMGYLDRLEAKLQETVRSHLVSDVPVGAFLSGGMDSSMIVAMMSKNENSDYKTFAVGVREQDFNELPYASLVAEYHGTAHIEACVDRSIIHTLPRMIWHLDEPSDPIAACQYYAAELAARYVKVVLGGDGGDELFAGFDRYLGVRHLDYYLLLPLLIRQKLIGPLLFRLSDSFSYKNRIQQLRWIQQVSHQPNFGERYAEATSFFRFNHADKRALYGESLWAHLGQINSNEVIAAQFDQAQADDQLDRMLYADFMTRLPEHSLMLTDRMTMAHGLELRSPFLDHELVELMATFPGHLKIRGRELKYVLRKLAADRLPAPITRRPKQGFMFPIAYWFRGGLYPFIRAFLLGSRLVKEGLFRKDRVQQLLAEHRANRVDHHVRLWMLLNLEIWHQIYMEGETPEALEDKIAGLSSREYPAGS